MGRGVDGGGGQQRRSRAPGTSTEGSLSLWSRDKQIPELLQIQNPVPSSWKPIHPQCLWEPPPPNFQRYPYNKSP